MHEKQCLIPIMRIYVFIINFYSRDETKQEEVWKKTMDYLKDHFTEEEIQCMEGTDPAVP